MTTKINSSKNSDHNQDKLTLSEKTTPPTGDQSASIYVKSANELSRGKGRTPTWDPAKLASWRKHRSQNSPRYILENLRERDVFYYLGAGSDWEPLLRLTHLCDIFIYTDIWQNSDVTQRLPLPGLEVELMVPLSPVSVASLSNTALIPPDRLDSIRQAVDPGRVEPWGVYARLCRSFGRTRRKIHFFYLGIEGITVFYNLFVTSKTSPKAICLKLGMSGGPLFEWNGALGELVRGCDNQPAYLAGHGVDKNWPYGELWHKLPKCWSVWANQNQPPVSRGPNPLFGNRKVIVKRGLLTPETVVGCQAIVLPIQKYLDKRQEWPQAAKIMLLAPDDQHGQIKPPDSRVTIINEKHRPLGALLDSITEECHKHGLTNVSSFGMGHEDEGVELDAWRRETGHSVSLTIFCEEAGDVAAFAPYADCIE